ncbi:MAG: hypothetical protein JST89_07980 [Cyanobacteria bacterium SZAS-4]|nr:hypothetical protein [Cyanobacteria bacterium SZAS-4]
MKIEEITKKSDNASNAGGDAYAQAAASAWAKPESGAGRVATKQGNNEVGSGEINEPGGGGNSPIQLNDGQTATGSMSGEKANPSDKKIQNPVATGGESNFAPPAKETKPEQGKGTGESKQSDKDAAVKHLPSLSII